jgi:hypothetical protein
VRALAGLALAAAAACGTFQDEDIVVDTRILAIKATMPDQVLDVDLRDPPPAIELLDQIAPSRVCALIADPSFDRGVRWSMTLCVLDSDDRCGSNAIHRLGSSVATDPELAVPEPEVCVTVEPDGNLLGVVVEAIENDSFSGLGGIDYGVSLVVGGVGVDPVLDQYAGKRLRVAPRIPASRRPNVNPHLDRIDVAIGGAEPVPLTLGRCVDQIAPLELAAGASLRLTPVEPDGVREIYVVPTLDGEEQEFTEALTYQWLGTAGSFSAGTTGGPRDVAGNPPPLFTDYRAPNADDLDGPTDVQLWIVQRDERLGSEWYIGCVRVVP